jgi:hypothetical protein
MRASLTKCHFLIMDRVMASTVYRLNSYLFDRLPVRNFLGSLLFNALDSAKISASMRG